MKRHVKQLNQFQLIFSTVVAFTVLSGAGSIALATQPNPSAQQTRMFETCIDICKLGVGAILGLMGATSPSDPTDGDTTAEE
ncbi:MAG TPA: hypothetical protein V6C78_00275 [Crinalium sp.]|jgi:hypothetical protein